MLTRPQVARIVDHTLLRPEATDDDIRRFCDEARELGTHAVCVNPCRVKLAAERLRGSDVIVCSVVGFPLGCHRTAVKVRETQAAVADGAGELDMVMAIGVFFDGCAAAVHDDIASVVEAAGGRPVKVIVETGLLSDPQTRRACVLAREAGASFVKTSTGFGPAGATVEAVRIMREAVGSTIGVKASGKIRDAATAAAMIAAGANRLGTSSTRAILAGFPATG